MPPRLTVFMLTQSVVAPAADWLAQCSPVSVAVQPSDSQLMVSQVNDGLAATVLVVDMVTADTLHVGKLTAQSVDVQADHQQHQ